MDTTNAAPEWRRPGYAQRFPLPDGCNLAWGCRAIYRLDAKPERGPRGKMTGHYNRTAVIDILHDRHEMSGGTDKERKAFSAWITKVGIPAIKLRCEQVNVGPRDDLTVEFSGNDHPYSIVASPNASYGYLYILAWRK